MRNYKYIDAYLDELLGDIYPQPDDVGHTAWADAAIKRLISGLPCTTVLDVGCSTGFAKVFFDALGIVYHGVTLGKDWLDGIAQNRTINNADFTFLPFLDFSFDLVFARHALEHSPMPLLTLFEWYRVSKRWLCLILPSPDYYGYGGRNHYFVMTLPQIRFLLGRAGWSIVNEYLDEASEYQFLCEKVERITPYLEKPALEKI